MYKKLVNICIMVGMLFFSIMVGRAMEPERHSVSTLVKYLEDKASQEPYAYAEIMAVSDYHSPYARGTAEISWEFFQTAEEFEEFFLTKEAESNIVFFENTEYTMKFVYYQYQLGEDIHALDLYHVLKERYDKEDYPLYASKARTRKGNYYFNRYPDSTMVIDGGVLYVMECKGTIDTEFYADAARKLIFRFSTKKLGANDLGGWGLSEEELYWIDHEERATHLKNPDRDFLEVRGIDTSWRGETLKENFAMLKEADYRIRLCEDIPLLQIHFSFAEEIPETGYKADLSDRFSTDRDYEMTVVNMETNELYQKQNVPLSIEFLDMISFLDLNADGYLDMQIDRSVIEEYKKTFYMLWNPEEKIFEIQNDREIAESRRQNQRQEVHMTEYVVQSGDTLWGIAEKFYGIGSLYERIEKENADVLSGNQYLLPGVTLRIPVQPF